MNELKEKTIKTSVRPQALRMFRLQGEKWNGSSIPGSKDRLSIASSQESDINLSTVEQNDYSIFIRFYCGHWFILNRNRSVPIKINGLQADQSILGPDCSTMLQTDNASFIFTTKISDDTRQLTPHDNTDTPPGAGEFILSVSDHKFRFKNDRSVLIGSNPACEIRNEEGRDFSGIISFYKGYFYFYPLIPNLFRIDGLAVNELTVLKSTCSIRTEKGFTMEFRGGPIPEGYYGDDFCLLKIGDDGIMQMKLLLPPSGKSGIVGRSKDSATIIIPTNDISRKHAQVISYESSVMVIDSHSTNGTFINDLQIQGQKRAKAGDTIEFGDTEFILCYN